MKKIITCAVLALFLAGFPFSPLGKKFLSVSHAKTLSIPKKISRNRYGFLSGGPSDGRTIQSYKAGWARPHVGPFLWDAIQSESGGNFSFIETDQTVDMFSKNKLGILATLWPFADWDQLAGANPDGCKVSDSDIFLTNKDRDAGYYLPQYRCNPNDWNSYLGWVRAVVERYDGDGTDDMPGLKIPVKYWEVMNEPDLDGLETLDFYMGGPSDYAELLTRTYQAIKEADPAAHVLIAGAAGGDNKFLNFYREVFQDESARNSFDIANVHCISSGDIPTFNVAPYKNMLAEFGLDKRPIWVTEAEAIVSSKRKANAEQTLKSARAARRLGAEKIFFTRYSFNASSNYGNWDKYSRKYYRKIFSRKWSR